MADVLPINFPIPPESSIASYDYFEITDGTGYKAVYGAKDQSSYFSTTNSSLFSDEIESSAVTAGGADAKVLDLDFDITLNSPRTVKGRFYANIPMSCDGNMGMEAIVKFRKWNGTTETDIANATSTRLSSSSSRVEDTKCVGITIPLTLFGAGETIRITIEIWASNNGASPIAHIGHDPVGRVGNASYPETVFEDNSKMIFLLPFKVQN